MKKTIAIAVSLALWVPPFASAALFSRSPGARSNPISRAYARSVLLGHLTTAGLRSSASIIPVIERVRGLDSDTQISMLADPELRDAVFHRAGRLLKAAQDPKSSFNQVREAHYELLLLERHIGILMPSRDQITLKRFLPQASEALEESQSRRVDSVARALDGTRPPLGVDSVNDASRMNETKVSAVVYPENEAELQKSIRLASSKRQKVSLSGARHSQGGQVASGDPESVHINVMKMNRVHYDPAKKLVTVGGGALWGDIQKILDAHGMSLDVTQVPNYFTVAGTLSVNAHGHNSDSGPVAGTVESMRVVTPDGSVVTASRRENAELFRLVLGGYGLFGAISEVTLRVRENVVYTPKFELIDFKDFPRYHAEVFRKLSPYGHAMLSMAKTSFLKKIHIVRYEEVAGKIPALVHDTWRDAFEEAVARTLNKLTVSGWIGKETAFRLLTGVLYRLAQKHQTRNRVMNEPFTFFDTGRGDEAQILQEYFIPPQNVVEFVERSRSIIDKYFLNMEMDAVRRVKADPDSFLPYAPTDRFGVVLISNHKTARPDFARLHAATRELIDLAERLGGTYYLPYRLAYDSLQLTTAYPRIRAFFDKKREYDPDELFSNKFYEKYGNSFVAPLHVGAPDVDLTDKFSLMYGQPLSLQTGSVLSPHDLDRLKQANVLFVKGLFGQPMSILKYFGDMKDSLTARGIDAAIIDTNTEAMPAVNAKTIAAAVEASAKPVWLVSHSKGGLDVLEMLLSRPDLRPKIRGWIPIEAPFHGSDVPDWYAKHRILGFIGGLLLKIAGGEKASLEDMETAARREFLAQNDAAIRRLAKEVRILSVGAWSPSEGGWNTLLKWRRDWIEKKRGKLNDGLVGLDDALLPYAPHVRLPHIDHADPVMRGPFSTVDRARLLHALLLTLGL